MSPLFFFLNDSGENGSSLSTFSFISLFFLPNLLWPDIASITINYNTILTAVVDQLVGWVGLLLDKKILQDLHMGTGLLLHHVTGFVLYVDV